MPGSDTILWVVCNTVDREHPSGGRPQKGFGDSMDVF